MSSYETSHLYHIDKYTAYQSIRLSRCPSRVTYDWDYLGSVFKGESVSLS
ncbi:unnamed protein product [Musa textilis]